MTDLTDDWMDPPPAKSWEHKLPTYPCFLIERERRVQGPITQWDTWETFDTASARDAALRTLREEHPAWHLRATDELGPPMAYL